MNTTDIGTFISCLTQSKMRRAQTLALIGAIALAPVALRNASAESGAKSSKQSQIQRAMMSDEISVHAAGRGNPWINLSDGREVTTSYSGEAELKQSLERNEARPLSLCSADFDEDGVPDLISGYAGTDGGIVTLLRGNVDSINPNAPEATQRKADGNFTETPFLSPAFVFSVPEAADFIGAGDFDGDGHWDVVVAGRGRSKLCLMSGDGRGGLRETKRIELPGGVTAMVVGEINRRDGLDDIVVGISGGQCPKVLVFEGPEGALRASPETFDLSAAPTSLALGELDDTFEMDLAVGAGRELIMLHGRDRKLSLDKAKQAQVTPGRIELRKFPYSIKSIALGTFIRNHTTDIALLFDDGNLTVLSRDDARVAKKEGLAQAVEGIEDWSSRLLATGDWSKSAGLVTARVSSTLVDNLVVVDSASPNIVVMAGTAKGVVTNEAVQRQDGAEEVLRADLETESGLEAVLPMRLNSDALSDLVVMRRGNTPPVVVSTAAVMNFVVTNTNDSGAGTLRKAITDANTNVGADTITFSILSGLQTIKPQSALPTITDPVTIDGTTQPGFSGKPLIQMSGSAAGFTTGLRIGAGRSVVRGLTING
ncbi:MAG: VCBS repeat-containing protein, partial [Blastocatellia bacterium]